MTTPRKRSTVPALSTDVVGAVQSVRAAQLLAPLLRSRRAKLSPAERLEGTRLLQGLLERKSAAVTKRAERFIAKHTPKD